MVRFLAVFGVVFAAAAPGVASALPLDEIRFGIVEHNLRIANGVDPKEDGPNLEAELVFTSPRALRILGKPRPYAMVSANLAGDTSFAAAGLNWRIRLSDLWSIEPSFGLAVHDGVLDNKYASSDPRAPAYEARHQLLGSRVLFRESLAVQRTFGARWLAQLYYEHLSNGEILTDGPNQALDEAGLRIGYRLHGR